MASYLLSGQDPAFFLNCPAIFVLERQRTNPNCLLRGAHQSPNSVKLQQTSGRPRTEQQTSGKEPFRQRGRTGQNSQRKVLAYSGNREEAFVAGVDRQDREK